MRVLVGLWVPLTLLLTWPVRLVAPLFQHVDAITRSAPPAVVDVNRPRTPDDCDRQIGLDWYGSRQRCLAELCAGQNVFNESLFDADNRRRKNPCYGQSPTEYEAQ
ncbi:MAG: hypothetical protein HYR72_25530 [Deltaproteobacteria bacterium]|nr:hypothetical protein [Deltaproteobacteria bacterium]MBI3388425.1 hypothetical protein [Deltaproteobacteria bacterium]